MGDEGDGGKGRVEGRDGRGEERGGRHIVCVEGLTCNKSTPFFRLFGLCLCLLLLLKLHEGEGEKYDTSPAIPSSPR
jgi:hypothetical protein